jgi:hypothetical protein
LPPSSGLAGADEVITTAPDESWEDAAFGRSAFTSNPALDSDNQGADVWDDRFEDTDDYDRRRRS